MASSATAISLALQRLRAARGDLVLGAVQPAGDALAAGRR